MADTRSMITGFDGGDPGSPPSDAKGSLGIGAIIGLGAVSLLSSVFSAIYSNNANKELIEKQNQESLAQWNRANAYNNPSAQMSRLSAAGLNPNLMYGNGTGSLLSAPSPELHAAQNNPVVNIDPLTAAQIANISADTEKKKAETKMTGEETNQIILDNFFRGFNKSIVEGNADEIRSMAKEVVQEQKMSSIAQVYQCLFSAGILASFFGYDESDSYTLSDGSSVPTYEVGNYHYSKEVHDKFLQLGLSEQEQTLLERSLFKSYAHAQEKVNKRAGEEADMEIVIPELINDAPKWLKPILIILNNWFNNGHMPNFIYSPHTSSSTSSKVSFEDVKNKIFNH